MISPPLDVTTENDLICVWIPGDGYPLLELDEANAADLANRILYALDEIRVSRGFR